ncbi:MAG: hypothetical protein ACNA7Q_07395, partial [Rhodobacterales bacterium]
HKDLCMTPFWPQDEGSACLGWRSGGPGPNAPTSHETQPLQRVGPSEAPAGGQAGAARRCRRAGDIGNGACYAEVFAYENAAKVSLGGVCPAIAARYSAACA